MCLLGICPPPLPPPPQKKSKSCPPPYILNLPTPVNCEGELFLMIGLTQLWGNTHDVWTKLDRHSTNIACSVGWLFSLALQNIWIQHHVFLHFYKGKQVLLHPVCFFQGRNLSKGIYLKRKEFAPEGTNSFLKKLTLLLWEAKIKLTELLPLLMYHFNIIHFFQVFHLKYEMWYHHYYSHFRIEGRDGWGMDTCLQYLTLS